MKPPPRRAHPRPHIEEHAANVAGHAQVADVVLVAAVRDLHLAAALA
jgi:hypothetical protein